jgi:tRNA-dihydrouridine synthase A
MQVILNGGLDDVDTTLGLLPDFAGVMLGRAAYRTPMIMAELAAPMFGRAQPTRIDIAASMADYADRHTAKGVPLHAITRHMLGLYHGQRGARLWRRHLGEEARNRSDGGALIREVAEACEAMAARLAA